MQTDPDMQKNHELGHVAVEEQYYTKLVNALKSLFPSPKLCKDTVPFYKAYALSVIEYYGTYSLMSSWKYDVDDANKKNISYQEAEDNYAEYLQKVSQLEKEMKEKYDQLKSNWRTCK